MISWAKLSILRASPRPTYALSLSLSRVALLLLYVLIAAFKLEREPRDRIFAILFLLALGVFLPLWNLGQAAQGRGGG